MRVLDCECVRWPPTYPVFRDTFHHPDCPKKEGAVLDYLPTDSVRSIVHLSGPFVCIDGRVIQRCQVCGAKLADSEGVMMPVGALGKPMPFPTWPEGRLIEVTTGNPTAFRVLNTPDDRKLPANSCLELA